MALIGADLRFVIRSSWDRQLEEGSRLREKLGQVEACGRVRIHIEQKGGRPARDANLEMRATPICFDGRAHSGEVLPVLEMNAVHLREVDTPVGSEPVDWLLLTSEPIETVEQVLRVVKVYCLRWLIEEYNKCCKSDGTRIEDLRMSSADNLLRASVLCMFAAVPLMWLRGELLEKDTRERWPVLFELPAHPAPPPELPPSAPCSRVFSTLQWTTLWQAIERNRTRPSEPPSIAWALHAIAKLGGWGNTKRTGRPGYPVLWKGWDKLLERVDAVQFAAAEIHAPN